MSSEKRYMRKPKHLKPGSAVRIIAPSSPVKRERLHAGLREIARMGLVPLVSERVFQNEGFLAGPDALRWRELQEAMTCDISDGVIAARGGYGAMRLLPHLERHVSLFRPKLFMGFSDVTALHIFFLEQVGIVTFHGPNVTQLDRLDGASLEATRNCLLGLCKNESFTYCGLTPITGGTARGRLIAGNLSLLASLCGTPYAPLLKGAILVIEEINEAPYRVDRMLLQLALQQDATMIEGVAFGDISIDDMSVIENFAKSMRKPVVIGFPVGHGKINRPVPLGVVATMDADSGILRVEEDPYDES